MDEEDDIWKQFLEQDDDDLTVPSQVLSDSYLIGFVIANIVGLRYYSGIINGRELVGLVREPLNPFDPNAIKVLNTRTVQVGHIERTVSAVLAPLLDSRIISAVEAIVPKPPARGRNPYRLPCQIHIFALPDSIPTVQCAIEDGGLHLFTPDDHEFALSESVIVKESTSSNASKERRRIDEIFALVGKEGKGIEPLEPPKDVISTDLFAHQKEGLGWLVYRENSLDLPLFWKEKNGAFLNVLTNHQTNERPEPLRGGIFADDMGLGKTLTLLSLIASNKPGTSISFTMVNDVGTSSGTKKRKSGNKRAVGSKKKRKADVGDYDGGLLDSNDELLGPKTTLVVCPSSVLTTWIAQLEQHTIPGSLKVYLYHGERTKEVDLLLRHDIVLTTYKTLALEFSSPHSPLKEIEWLRVILDEAHVIKNFASQQTKAVFELKAERRWVVTGTPIQNSSFDLFSLMAFLRFLPFSIKSYWQSLVQRPLDQGSTSGISRLQALMASISLRRMKGTSNGSNSFGLPPKTVETCLVELSSEEREQYEKMESEAKSTLREYINADTVLRNYSTVLHIILRLRQICNNVALCPSDLKSLLLSNSLEDASKNPELLKKLASMLEDGDDFDCPVCLSPPAKTIITRCAHIFCKSCILKTLKTLNPRCPICRQPLSETDLFLAPKPKASDENPTTDFSASSKTSALLNLLLESKRQKESTKSVVFSQFRKMLLLLEEPLMAAGFGVVRLDGSMSMKKRAEAMKEFGSDRSGAPTVLLASLKAAGAGIDLAVASRVYLVEPWWNPAAEEQAMDRVHRIGQKEEVKVVRLIVKDSIEERIMVIQERKKKLAGGLFGRKDAKEQKEMRVEDIRAMLRL